MSFHKELQSFSLTMLNSSSVNSSGLIQEAGGWIQNIIHSTKVMDNTDSSSKGAEPREVAQENFAQKSDHPRIRSLCSELERAAYIFTVLAGS